MTRFYCENCGKEVEESHDICPHCGAFFTAIKCPKCGFRGKLHQFDHGCPRCGYLSERDFEEIRQVDLGETRKPRKPLPTWLFLLILGIMLLSFFILSRIYVQL